jgi:short-subunit dehydrogenase
MELAGKRVLITGASSGIGAALAERCARLGAVVGITARRRDRLEEVLAKCQAHSPESRMWVHDLADLSAVDALAKEALAELGSIDVLVNNAGVPKRKHVTALDYATVERVMQLNYLSPVRLTLAVLPHMLERGSGLVVNVSSVAATLSSPGESCYDASKSALAVFTEAMAVDLWDRGVRALVVYPGVVDTELFTIPDNDPLPGSIEKIPVDELVDGVLDAIANDAIEVYVPAWFKEFATGKAADVTAFLTGCADWVRQQAAQPAG